MRPLIGLTLWIAPPDEHRVYPTPYPFEFLGRAYSDMVRKAGGAPVLLPNTTDPEEARRALGVFDGLLLTGGDDIQPKHYGEQARTDTVKTTPERDVFELAAIREADALGLPILGICRGAQVLNVAHGGTLFQDLREFRRPPTNDHTRGGAFYRRFHDVVIEHGSRLHEIMQRDTITIATSHHQAVKDIAAGLCVSAHAAEDNVVEAVEAPGTRFVVAVQWHPEVLPDDDATRRLAAAFVEAARRDR